jgi:hypothetical protein
MFPKLLDLSSCVLHNVLYDDQPNPAAMCPYFRKIRKGEPALVDGSKEGNPAHMFTINDKIHFTTKGMLVCSFIPKILLSSRSPEIQGIQLDNYIINGFISTSGRCWRVFNPIAKTTRFFTYF